LAKSTHRPITEARRTADSGIEDAVHWAATTSMTALVDRAVREVQSSPGAKACGEATIWWGMRSRWRTCSTAYQDVAIDMNWWALLRLHRA